MTEYAVTIVLREVEVSADSPAEAAAKAAQQVAADVTKNTSSVTATKLDRIKVPGFKR